MSHRIGRGQVPASAFLRGLAPWYNPCSPTVQPIREVSAAMETANRIAFKEWAVICAALERRGQIAILRKGGIHEGRQGFRVAYPEFWLFPTYLHQEAQGLVGEAQSLLVEVSAQRPPQETVRLEHYAVVKRVFHLSDESQLKPLDGHHLWSPATIRGRFIYREPGLFLLLVRVYKIAQALEFDSSPYFAGCRSWVELPEPLATAGCQPVLTDEEFVRRERALLAAIESAVRQR